MPDPRTVTFCGLTFHPILGIVPVCGQFIVITVDGKIWRVYQETYRADEPVWRYQHIWTL